MIFLLLGNTGVSGLLSVPGKSLICCKSDSHFSKRHFCRSIVWCGFYVHILQPIFWNGCCFGSERWPLFEDVIILAKLQQQCRCIKSIIYSEYNLEPSLMRPPVYDTWTDQSEFFFLSVLRSQHSLWLLLKGSSNSNFLPLYRKSI